MAATAENVTPPAAAPAAPTSVRDKPLVPVGSGAIEAFASASNFEQAWRMGQALSTSDLVPEAYKGKPANALIALNIASRLGADVMAVMQSLDIIHGRPSWRSTFIIAAINTCGKFSPLRFEISGEGMGRKCVAWARERGTGERLDGPEVSMAMAKAEGWSEKNGSKWKTMPDLMLRYRSAAFFGRLYAPEILLGMQTAEEVADVIDVTPRAVEPQKGVAGARAMLADPPAETVDTETGEITGAIPHYNLDQARAELLAAKSLAALERTWKAIRQDFKDTKRELPVALEAAYNELRDGFADAEELS